jgi:hypothetical protein
LTGVTGVGGPLAEASDHTSIRPLWTHPITTTRSPAQRVDRVAELMDSLVDAVAQLTTSENWLRWLEVARRFHRYRFWRATEPLGLCRWSLTRSFLWHPQRDSNPCRHLERAQASPHGGAWSP